MATVFFPSERSQATPQQDGSLEDRLLHAVEEREKDIAAEAAPLDQPAAVAGPLDVDLPVVALDMPVVEEPPFFPPRHLTRLQRVLYSATRPMALFGLYSGYFRSLYGVAGVRDVVNQSKEFLLDIGGEPVRIPSSDGAELSGMYFSADHFRARADEAYRKWRGVLQENPKLTRYLEADLEGRDLRELMRLPEEVTEDCHFHKMGSVRCLGAGNIFEVNPQAVLQNLYRGMDHLAFNYRGINESTGSPNFEGTCIDAYHATRYLQDRLHCTPDQLLECGTSLGGGPALFTARRIPHLDVLVDRSFSRLADVRLNRCIAPAFRYLANTFYPYPNVDWIQEVSGRACVLHAQEDTLMDPGHAERLVDAYVRSRLGEEPDAEEELALRGRCYIEAAGGHNSRCGGDREYSWFADARSQRLYTKFIKDEPLTLEEAPV